MLGQGEAGLGGGINDRPGIAGQTHCLLVARRRQRALALREPPVAAQAVESADGGAVFAFGRQALGLGQVRLLQAALPEVKLGVKQFSLSGPIGVARPIAAHGVEQAPGGGGLRPWPSLDWSAKRRTRPRKTISLPSFKVATSKA
ncbi:MAG: hypothetical protein R3F31_11570 [Verrucomicrobiales bacterium]